MTKILNETLLTNEFTFGFELEAIVSEDSDIVSEDSWVGGNDSTEDDIQYYLDTQLYSSYGKHRYNSKVKGESRIHQDSSVQVEELGDEGYPFEYSSPILPANPDNFARVIRLLKEMGKDGIYTNSSCGFHHHLAFNGMTPSDMVWIYCNLATDSEAYQMFSKFKVFEFEDEEYASFDDITELGDALMRKDFPTAFDYITISKYRAFRLHPQGTIEWRGPRNFLNNKNIDYIKDFYILFNQLIRKFKKYMDNKTLEDTTITKKELFDEFNKYNEMRGKDPNWSYLVGTKKSKGMEKLLNKFSTNPYIILKIMDTPDLDKFFRKVMENYSNRTIILSNLRRNIEDKFLKPDEISRMAKYIKSVYDGIPDITKANAHHELSVYGLDKYCYTGKDLLELLDEKKNISEFMNFAMMLVREKIYDVDKDEIYNKIKNTMLAANDVGTALFGVSYNFMYTASSANNKIFTILTEEQLADLTILCFKKLYNYAVETDSFSPSGRAPNAMFELCQSILPHFKSVIQKYRLNDWNTLVKNMIERMKDFKGDLNFENFIF